ncbi:MAG: High-affinity zinc uptake system ATP-binding protein ZnuC [bacterium ADurb.Bin236]|nr:MAG: High-affinity zinc uptake system ATP-binding protein ZnuC [bacterium ADurb.Bin236]HPN93860.1 ABC transporter ATP-binding protein [bacterium]
MSDAIVKAKGISFSYDGAATPAIAGVSMDVERGQVFGMVGPNGGGKSTLLKLVAGLIKPEEGQIEFDFRRSANGRGVGYMPQHASANWRFPIKVIDVILMGMYGELGMMKRVGASERAAAAEAAEIMEVGDMSSRHISELSGGQRQRVFIARALAAKPELLLLDEPAAGMDAHSQDSFYALIERLRDDLGLTIIIVTHDMGVIPRVCNQVACVNVNVVVHDKPERLTCPVTEGFIGEHKEIFLHGDIPHRVVRRGGEVSEVAD